MTLRFSTLPPSTNNLYSQGRNGRRFLTTRGRDYKEATGWEARQQHKGAPLKGPIAVEITLEWPDRRKHDIDNLKALLDALTGIVYEDDGQIEDLHTMRVLGSKTPGVVMHVWPQ